MVLFLLPSRPDWPTAKGLLSDPNFLKRLMDYDKDNVADSTLKKLKKYIDNPKFVPEIVEKTSKVNRGNFDVCGCLSWVTYGKSSQRVVHK